MIPVFSPVWRWRNPGPLRGAYPFNLNPDTKHSLGTRAAHGPLIGQRKRALASDWLLDAPLLH